MDDFARIESVKPSGMSIQLELKASTLFYYKVSVFF